jgi:hypothetical protein
MKILLTELVITATPAQIKNFTGCEFPDGVVCLPLWAHSGKARKPHSGL